MPEQLNSLTVEPGDSETRRAVYGAIEKQFNDRFQIPLQVAGDMVVFCDLEGREIKRIPLATVQGWVQAARQGARLVLKAARVDL